VDLLGNLVSDAEARNTLGAFETELIEPDRL
jgi:hypothetical protein